MTLGELARVLDVEPKWVLNTMAGLHLPGRYSLGLARQLAVVRTIHESAGIPVALAFAMARRILHAYRGEITPVTLSVSADGDVALTLDVYRLLSSVSVRLAEVRTMFAPRARGRPSTRKRDALREAVDWGLDVTLIRDNLTKSPEQRLRQLDDMVAFSRRVHRNVSHT